jgi:flagellar motor switch protein FliM
VILTLLVAFRFSAALIVGHASFLLSASSCFTSLGAILGGKINRSYLTATRQESRIERSIRGRLHKEGTSKHRLSWSRVSVLAIDYDRATVFMENTKQWHELAPIVHGVTEFTTDFLLRADARILTTNGARHI